MSSPPARLVHREPETGERLRLIIITGLSGAGKSWAIKCFEDLGYYCVDNLPTTLIPTFAELCVHSTRRITRIALGVDIREREYLHSVVEVLSELRGAGYLTEVLFLEASEEALSGATTRPGAVTRCRRDRCWTVYARNESSWRTCGSSPTG